MKEEIYLVTARIDFLSRRCLVAYSCPLTFCYSQVSATASWDSSVHDSVHLNRVTPQNERIYLIVKTTVQLSHPAAMELVLRKRIAANIYNKQVVNRADLPSCVQGKNYFPLCHIMLCKHRYTGLMEPVTMVSR